MAKEYDREGYIKDWAEKILKLPEGEQTPFDVAAALVTRNRNFQTAAAILFGLSTVTHLDYIKAAAKHWEDNFPKGSVADKQYCIDFQKYYIDEVAPYPQDA